MSEPEDLSKGSPSFRARIEECSSNPYVHKHSQRLEEIRRSVWRYLDRGFQIKVLRDQTIGHAKRYYDGNSEALSRVSSVLDYIFQDASDVAAIFSVPRRIGELLSHTPCLFTMFPGLGTHTSISQYDIVFTDRHSTVTSRTQVNLQSAFTRNSRIKSSLPFTVANMRSSISEDLADLMIQNGLVPIFHRFRRPLNAFDCDSTNPTVQSPEQAQDEKIKWADKYQSKAFFSSGVLPDSLEFSKKLIERGVAGICVDIALGNSVQAVAAVLELREFIVSGGYSAEIIAGNVDTAEGYLELALAGADLVKVGIGPGSACTTRTTAGAGAGQGSALMDVARAKFILGDSAAAFIADGGIQGPKDILTSQILQASGSMLGILAAKTYESGALKKTLEGKGALAWNFGEASAWARIYEQGQVKPGYAVEGQGGWVPVSGSFVSLIAEIKGALTNALPYYNSRSLEELRAKSSIPQQLCDLILGGTTGIYTVADSHKVESATRLV